MRIRLRERVFPFWSPHTWPRPPPRTPARRLRRQWLPASCQRRLNTGVPKAVTFPQQRLSEIESKRVRQTIAKVQTGSMATAFAEIGVSLAGQARLVFGHRLDHELSFTDQFVQTSTNDRITLGIQDDPTFEIACRGQPSGVRVRDGLSVDRGVVLLFEDRDNRRRVHDHAGNPRSS